LGIRMYQEVGLKPEAEAFLNENALRKPTSFCPHCNGVLSEGFDVIHVEHHDSFYEDGPYLRTIVLKDGRITKEVVQEEPWSSGPVCFLCLEIDGQMMFEWTQDEIEEQL